MGPDDPIFFDRDADETTPYNPDTMLAEVAEAARSMPDPRSRAILLAYAECGYLVTETNQHMFTAHEVEAFLDAMDRHQT